MMNKDITNYNFEQSVREAIHFTTEKCRDIANPQDELFLRCLKKVSNSALRALPENFVELFTVNRAIEIFLSFSFASSYGGESDPFFSAENERLFESGKIRQLREIQKQVVQKLGNYDASADDLTNYLYPPATPISSQPAAPHVLSSHRMSAYEVINRHADEILDAEKNGFEGNKTQWFNAFAKRLDCVSLRDSRFNGNTLKKGWDEFKKTKGKSSAKSHSKSAKSHSKK